MEFQIPNNFETEQLEPQVFLEEYDSTCSTPYVSTPSSPGPGLEPGCTHGGFFYSAPVSPMHFTMTSVSSTQPSSFNNSLPVGSEFEFSARFGSSGSSQIASMMTSADELFLNGQIRPLKLSTHLEKSQVLVPLRRRRRTRSMSTSRNATFDLNIDDQVMCSLDKDLGKKADNNETTKGAQRSSKKWVFLKRFIRSKSEGRGNNDARSKEKKPAGNKSKAAVAQESKEKPSKKGSVNGIGKRRVIVSPSPHELHYTANRAQAEEMRKRTFLPYRQGLIGCLGFSSKGYGAMNALATRALNHVSSR